ncbi:DUF6216 family protein [Raoultella ornithinolytica]|nr:DUF6216 family protein [Raoultella ornithinolytica]MDI0397004.1 DUF6216 family protein [Raoultella ornithinolytica]MDI0425573.1 DUF6216 family protein [Raoultella ornithinolytica]MDI0443712.1 DUF6216 family protein [Raoultella ornithinolytica]MDI0449819.1 DUF6216 family protein [Raoultella ornithinolytica]
MPAFQPDVISEFSGAPLSTTVAALTVLAFLFQPLRKAVNGIFKYKKGHGSVLKNAGVPPFILNFFAISIPLKKLPSTGWPEKLITLLFSALFAWSSWYFVPPLVQTFTAPPDTALLIWKKSGDRFYISRTAATEATLLTPPRWTVTANDCQANKAPTKNTASVLDREYRDDLCRLLTTAEGKEYLEESIKNFEKDKIFTYSSIFIIEFMLLWLLLGFMLMIHYTNKVRHFILLEQQKAINCVQGSFAATGIYAIYQELEERDARRPRR